MAPRRSRRVQLLQLAFGDRAIQPVRDVPGIDRFRVNGATVTHGVVNAWLADGWTQWAYKQDGPHLALTALGLEVIGGEGDA